MMEAPKVSVIIPVYNTAAYLEAAVRSIMRQSLCDLEIWLIDDGSTDQSPAIEVRLAAEDDRIYLHRQPNSGPSEARNAGIARSRGRYLYFMDSDDLLEADALQLCYAKCEQEQLDLVFFDADTFGGDLESYPWLDYHRAAAFEDRLYTGRELLGQMFDRKKYTASPCLYLTRREFVTTQGLIFHPGIFHEDELFTMRLFLAAQRVGRIDRTFFKRRLRPHSTMSKRFSELNLRSYMTVFAQLQAFATEQDSETRQLAGRYLRYTLNPVLHTAWVLPWRVRVRTACTVLRHYARYVQVTSLVVLLVKLPLKKWCGR